MVQSKLGIKADQTKPDSGHEKSKTTIGKSHPQYPDGRTSRGPDLKKMKKSRSIKRSSIDSLSLRSFPVGMEVPQPGKPPPLVARVAAIPQKQKQHRDTNSDTIPNYMKPTSSSDARKERSSVTPLRTRISSAANSTPKTSSEVSKAGSPLVTNSRSPAMSLTRSSSLRFVSTLTKTPSFKPVRPSSAKRCSKAVLCTNLDAQRATCSSTLKDSKFPKYLTLSPGATEAEGTSAMKVCPYTYCSLNGHRHSPLPPLKCFISTRRRAIKTQRNFRAEALNANKKELAIIDGATSMEAEDGRDFFVEIYAETKGKDICNPKSFPEEEELEVHEEINLPISVVKEAQCVEGLQGKDGAEVERQETVEESGLASLDMEWDGHEYSTLELDEAEDHPIGNKSAKTEKGTPNEEVQHEEDQACPETLSPEDEVMEISETSQLSHCFTYDQYSSSEEDAMKEAAYAEETAESLKVELSEEPARTKSNLVLDQPREDQDSTGLSFEQELESSSPSQYLCGEKEDAAAVEVNDNEDIADNRSLTETQHLSNEQSHIIDVKKSQTIEILGVVDDEKMKMAHEVCECVVDPEEVGVQTESSIAEEASLESNDGTSKKLKSRYTRAERIYKQDAESHKIRIEKNSCKKLSEEEQEPRRFSPRDHNYLPVVPDQEAEKVDLRHQMMDEKRSSEEWMVDYALRQAVTRLQPARKRKVALLVEAFEKVMPIPKVRPISQWETLLTSPRPIQACS